jgi:hypothetical protein
MQEWEWDQKENKLDLLLRLIAVKQYDEAVGRCAVELAMEIRQSLIQTEE